MIDFLKSYIDSPSLDLRGIRRHLHRNPELSFEEFGTSDYICSLLDEWGIKYTRDWVRTGVVAMIHGKQEGSGVVALRADMDALPIQEKSTHDYISTRAGVMHACGHDVHMTCVLGAAHLLHTTRDQWHGSVKLIFQPGEERLPGGAIQMIEAGVLKNPDVNTVFGQHVHPSLEAGTIGICPGMHMASADEIYLKVHGKGGHAGMPHKCIDPVLISIKILQALQLIVSRYADPTTPTVLSFGDFRSIGGSTNVIPNEVEISGTLRTVDEDWRAEIHQRIRSICSEVAGSLGGSVDLEIRKGYPSLYNDPTLASQCMQWAKELLGDDQVLEIPLRMTAEDFAYFSKELPVCFYRLGTGNKEKGITAAVHTDRFDIDEKALSIGAAILAHFAVQRMK